MPDKIITENDYANLAIKAEQLLVDWYRGLRTAETTPMPPPDVVVPPRAGWNSGVFTNHHRAESEAWFQWLGRGPGPTRRHVCAFVTHDQTEAAMTSDWWKNAIPPGTGLSLRIPLVPKLDPSFTRVRSATFRAIARQAAAIDPTALICPGWEMNLRGWPSHVNPGNLVAWKGAWMRCYDAMKSERPDLIIGFNPNGGDINATGVDLRKVMDGIEFDVAGPDQYDCWPGFTGSDPATFAFNRTAMLERPGGLNWWAQYTKDRGIPLIVPEWGVSSGSQWKGNQGGDNPAYIRAMFDFFKSTPNLLLESYFNEPAAYVASAIFRPGGGTPQNPKASAAYHELWRTLP